MFYSSNTLLFLSECPFNYTCRMLREHKKQVTNKLFKVELKKHAYFLFYPLNFACKLDFDIFKVGFCLSMEVVG